MQANTETMDGLSEEQKERVGDMVQAFMAKNQGRLPDIDGLVRLVRSMPVPPTPNTFEANGKKI